MVERLHRLLGVSVMIPVLLVVRRGVGMHRGVRVMWWTHAEPVEIVVLLHLLLLLLVKLLKLVAAELLRIMVSLLMGL